MPKPRLQPVFSESTFTGTKKEVWNFWGMDIANWFIFESIEFIQSLRVLMRAGCLHVSFCCALLLSTTMPQQGNAGQAATV